VNIISGLADISLAQLLLVAGFALVPLIGAEPVVPIIGSALERQSFRLHRPAATPSASG
jgi:hypothetical protein